MYLAEEASITRQVVAEDLSGEGRQSFPAVNPNEPYKKAKARLLERFEREYLMKLMQDHDGNLSRAARQAGLVRHHLRELCNRYGIPCGAEAGKRRHDHLDTGG
jgi:DNA-binding NtrC family response regulator